MGESYSTVVITDSRGKGIHSILSGISGVGQVAVMVHPGAGSELAALKSITKIKQIKPDLVILMTGICDLTWRHSTTGVTSLRHNILEDSVERVVSALSAARDLLLSLGEVTVSIATVTGIDLSDYNFPARKGMSPAQYSSYESYNKCVHEQQEVLDGSILVINRRITKLNLNMRVPTTWTAGVVHAHFNKKAHHYYRRLADGCHPDEETKSRWASQLAKTIRRIGLPGRE